MATNKFAQECKDCGGMVPAGKGVLTKEWSNQDDDNVWVVRHADKSICQAVVQADVEDQKRAQTVNAIVAYIKEYGDKASVQDGGEVVWDGRHGYNQIGWLLTRDDDNTLYLTSRANLDGHDMSETYRLADADDDRYGNSNADIIRILKSGKSADTKPFEF